MPKLIVRYVVGFVLFWGPIAGTLPLLGDGPHPWWSWACLAFLVLCFLALLPGLIRNGFAGFSPSTSPWDHIVAAEQDRKAEEGLRLMRRMAKAREEAEVAEEERFEQLITDWKQSKAGEGPKRP
jgi:hypothetical protein